MHAKRRNVTIHAQEPRGDRRGTPRGGRRMSDQVAVSASLERTTAYLHDRAPLILVVDDFSDGREMICEYLGFLGFRVAYACSGAETLVRALELRPDLVLLDLQLRDMDGFEVLARLRAAPEGEALNVAVFTAHAMDTVRQRVMQAGAVMFIPKPCELQSLAV